MKLSTRELVANAGRRFPIDLVGTPDRTALPDVAWIVDEVRLTGEAFAQLSTIYLEVTIQARLHQPCNRCLEPVESTLTLEEPFELQIEPGADEVDPMPLVLEIVLSAYDANVLCKQDCKGLCPSCGVNLNQVTDHECEAKDDDRTTLRDLLE